MAGVGELISAMKRSVLAKDLSEAIKRTPAYR
jgi:hypothetical protein